MEAIAAICTVSVAIEAKCPHCGTPANYAAHVVASYEKRALLFLEEWEVMDECTVFCKNKECEKEFEIYISEFK